MDSFSIRNLSFSYPEEERLVLKDINLDIKEGEFIVLCGASGCGKTTLLRQLKPILSPHGIKSGEIFFKGKPLEKLEQREEASEIGFVLQNPENQIVTDKVWHELAFGLESLGYDTPTIRLRVAEMASFFGIQNWFYKDVTELSGGQMQLLNLAGIMSMQPSVLILDEPTSQLDPIAAADFLATLGRINRELGTTVILTEHRLDEAFPLADRAIVMDDGSIIADGLPKDVGQDIGDKKHKMFLAMPVPMRIHAAVDNNLECPITVREGREWLNEYSKDNKIKENLFKTEIEEKRIHEEVVVEVENAWFRYEKNLPDVLKGASIRAHKGELLAILGGNGTGKTTTLSLISGLNRPYRGKIKIKGEDLSKIPESKRYNGLLGVLPQNPQSLFVKNTVEEDLYEMLENKKIPKKEKEIKLSKIIKLCKLEKLINQHPYDLSGGEQQRLALGKVLLLEPEILLLDEPTKGMDAEFKQEFAAIMRGLQKTGITIIMVSHDIEFCAKYANHCALFFDGGVVTEGAPRKFFSGNSFYTTAANRQARHLIPEAVTAEDVIKSCEGEVNIEEEIDIEEIQEIEIELEKERSKKSKKKQRKIGRRAISILSLIVMILSLRTIYPILSDFAWKGLKGEPNQFVIEDPVGYSKTILTFIGSLIIFFISTFERGEKPPTSVIQVQKEDRKLPKRTIVSAFLILLLIPFTIYFGVYYLGDRKYYFISLLIILEVMIPFFMVFEGREPAARELVIIAVLCALGVVGRAAFFMIPQFKPVAAIVIISGVAFGAESGFLVGAMTMLLSNIMYGQGPWTPWQMFAMGIIGFLAGIFFRKGLLRRDRMSLAIFGGISVFLVYGGIMNPASVIMFQSKINKSMILASFVTGVPFDLIHAASTVFFLLVIGEPMLEKLDRIKVKYGLVEN